MLASSRVKKQISFATQCELGPFFPVFFSSLGAVQLTLTESQQHQQNTSERTSLPHLRPSLIVTRSLTAAKIIINVDYHLFKYWHKIK